MSFPVWSGVRFRHGLGPVFVIGLLCLTGCATGQRGVAQTHGIANFAWVNNALYRGSQPDAASLQRLKEIGVKTIVNLRSGQRPEEEREARRLGLNYVTIPMRGTRGPSNAAVLEALQAIERGPKPVYVHCRYGCERTGTVMPAIASSAIIGTVRRPWRRRDPMEWPTGPCP